MVSLCKVDGQMKSYFKSYFMIYTKLRKKLKDAQDRIPELQSIRFHRSISWIKAAEDHEKEVDIKLITLWIAFNSLYAIENTKNESLNERDRFAGFIDKLISQDTESRIYNLLWNTYSGAVRMLIENKYVYGPFWDAQRGLNKNWEKGFNQSITDANNALANMNVNYLLRIVLDRLYILRNQLIHGGATYKSKVNRSQVQDGCKILINLLPIMVEIMMENPEEDWGEIFYPPISS